MDKDRNKEGKAVREKDKNDSGNGKRELGLYLHIPFCKAKCHYCDFNSYPGREEMISAYFDAIKTEIGLYAERLKGYAVKTAFIGGGTPSFVDARFIHDIVEQCQKHFDIRKDAEITIESNPGTLTLDKLRIYYEGGINRLSIGLQAWQDCLLKELGRIHNRREFLDNYELARKVGFRNINTDLIFGLPGQTMEQWEETITNIIRLGVEHVSCYSLKIEEGTVFGDRLDKGELKPMEDEDDRAMYHYAVRQLKDFNYWHYEISNFSKPGYECKHNLTYWKEQPYIGLGAGAHSFFEGKRFHNVYDLERYIQDLSEACVTMENIEPIGKKEEISEYIILGLRLIEGICFQEFEKRYGMDLRRLYSKEIKRLTDRKLIVVENNCMRLSKEGLDLANQVFMEFL